MVGGHSVLGPPPTPISGFDLDLDPSRDPLLDWAGLGWAVLTASPTHNRFMMRRDGLQKGNSGKKATKEIDGCPHQERR